MSREFNWNVYRDKLHALRRRLDMLAPELREEALHGVGGESTGDLSTAPIHQADRASQETEAAVSLGLAENEAELRQQVEAALRRLDEGTFGICGVPRRHRSETPRGGSLCQPLHSLCKPGPVKPNAIGKRRP